jgi:hypothetical protein
MTMTATLVIKDLEKQITDGVLKTSKQVLDKAFSGALLSINSQVGNLIDYAIKNSPEYAGIVGGQLGQELGVPNPAVAMQTIIVAIQNAMKITYQPLTIYARQLRGSITVEVLRRDFSDALSASGAEFVTAKGVNIPWLSWLLLEGDRIIIANYDIKIDPAHSRTGGVIMGKTKRGGWRIPPQYSGTARDNFLIRALDTVVKSIADMIEIEVVRRI